MRERHGVLGGSTFLRTLGAAVRALAPDELGSLHHATRHSMAQWWYGNRALHYEGWHRPRLGAIELGLHFEADALTNARLLGAFRARTRMLRHELGDVRIEEWDRGWTRLWESLPVVRLDEPLRELVAARIVRYIATLEPILREELPADVPWDGPSAARAPRRPTRGRSR